jgi:DNA-binding NarL/FixJ family response regulator
MPHTAGHDLTDGEVAALTAYAIGLTCTATGRRLNIAPSTASRWQRDAARKLGAYNMVHAAALAAAAGILDPAHLKARTIPAEPAAGNTERGSAP